MTLALRFQLAHELLATGEAVDNWTTRSPLFYQIRSGISIAFALLQLAKTSLRLNHLADKQVMVRAEGAYAKSVRYAEQLPEEERTSARFELGQLRTALDDFHSAENKTDTPHQ
jgi:hypothetical protein